MPVTDKLVGRLGICRRSGHLAVGCDAVIGWMRLGKARAVVLAADLSAKTEKEIRFTAKTYPARLLRTTLTKDQIGQALGFQKPVGVLATDDRGFAAAFEKDCPDRQEEDAI